MKFRPLRGRVLIAKSDHDTGRMGRTKSGLYIPPPLRTRDDTYHVGRVLAMGPPPRTTRGAEVPVDFRIGDEVIFVWTQTGTEDYRTTSIAELHDGPIAVVTHNEVLAVLEPS